SLPTALRKPPAGSVAGLPDIHQHEFGVFKCRYPQFFLFADCRAVPGFEDAPVDLDPADRWHPVGEALATEFIGSRLTRLEAGAEHPAIRMDSPGGGNPPPPLASGTNLPARSAPGNGREPQDGGRPRWFGMIQIWNIRVCPGSRLYSLWTMPVPALMTWTSPASVRPSLPWLSRWLIAPS